MKNKLKDLDLSAPRSNPSSGIETLKRKIRKASSVIGLAAMATIGVGCQADNVEKQSKTKISKTNQDGKHIDLQERPETNEDNDLDSEDISIKKTKHKGEDGKQNTANTPKSVSLKSMRKQLQKINRAQLEAMKDVNAFQPEIENDNQKPKAPDKQFNKENLTQLNNEQLKLYKKLLNSEALKDSLQADFLSYVMVQLIEEFEKFGYGYQIVKSKNGRLILIRFVQKVEERRDEQGAIVITVEHILKNFKKYDRSRFRIYGIDMKRVEQEGIETRHLTAIVDSENKQGGTLTSQNVEMDGDF